MKVVISVLGFGVEENVLFLINRIFGIMGILYIRKVLSIYLGLLIFVVLLKCLVFLFVRVLVFFSFSVFVFIFVFLKYIEI